MLGKMIKIALCFALIGAIVPVSASYQIDEGMYSYETTLEEVFSETEIEEINQKTKEIEEQGFTLEDRTVRVYVSRTRDNTISIAEVSDSFTEETKEYSVDQSEGMKYVLDRAWDFTLNILSDMIEWIEYPAIILGVSPSDFMSTWYQGDSLKSTLSYVQTTRFYRGSNDWGERTFFVTEKRVATVYADLYTVKNGAPFRITDETTRTFKTKRFDDTSYSIAYANYLRNQGVMVYEEDVYEG